MPEDDIIHETTGDCSYEELLTARLPRGKMCLNEG